MTLYDEIGRNNRMTAVLFILYSLFYGAVVFAALILLGIMPSLPTFTIATFALLVLFYFISFSQGPNLIMGVMGAKEVQKKEYPYLYNSVDSLSIGAGIPMPKVFVIESDALNAFATGPDPKHAAIAVTSGLLKKLNRAELEGVLAHEMSHIRNFDIRTAMVAAVLAMAVALLADISLRMLRTRDGGERRGGSSAVFLIALVFMILAPFISLLIRLAISRNREYAADASGAMLTRYPEGLASALGKIEKYYEAEHRDMPGINDATRHFFIFDPMKKSFLTLFSTHPPIEERIKRLQAM